MKTADLKTTIIFLPVIILLFFISYHSTILWMIERWGGTDSYYSHGYLIPFISGYLIWLKKNDLKTKFINYSIFGLILVLFAILLHLLGTILYIYSISGFSMFFFIIGAVLFLYGRKITKNIIFPLSFLVFMVPLPLAILSAFTFPLKILVAKAGGVIVNLLGVPIVRQGFDISIPGGNLVVGNPCSGLRSLISFLAIGALLAYFTNSSFIKKLFLFLLAIPIAILSNALRVTMLILISHYYGLAAASPESIWHMATGIMVFVIGLLLLISISRVLK